VNVNLQTTEENNLISHIQNNQAIQIKESDQIKLTTIQTQTQTTQGPSKLVLTNAQQSSP
jgi:hypothetical protein